MGLSVCHIVGNIYNSVPLKMTIALLYLKERGAMKYHMMGIVLFTKTVREAFQNKKRGNLGNGPKWR